MKKRPWTSLVLPLILIPPLGFLGFFLMWYGADAFYAQVDRFYPPSPDILPRFYIWIYLSLLMLTFYLFTRISGFPDVLQAAWLMALHAFLFMQFLGLWGFLQAIGLTAAILVILALRKKTWYWYYAILFGGLYYLVLAFW